MNASSDAIFKALADPTRRAIFERLSRDGELTVSVLTRRAGVSQPAVQSTSACSNWRASCASGATAAKPTTASDFRGLGPLINWLNVYAVFWRDKFDRLEDLLDRMDQ